MKYSEMLDINRPRYGPMNLVMRGENTKERHMSLYSKMWTELKGLFFLKMNLLNHQPVLDAWDKSSDLVHWEDPEGLGGEGGGRRDRDGEYM